MSLIVFIGIPGCGKSSAAREIAKKWDLGMSSWQEVIVNENGSGFFEPEEKDWPEFARSQSEHLDDFSMMTWFRAIHVPFIYKAKKISQEGKTAIVDSYFDKLTYSYLGKEPWLMHPSNEYFDIMKQIASKDREKIPNPDYLVFVKVNEEVIKDFLKRRGRESDGAPEYLASVLGFQDRLLTETKNLCQEKNIKLIIFPQEISSPQIVANKLVKELENQGLVYENKMEKKQHLIQNQEIESRWYEKAFYWPIWTSFLTIFFLIIVYYLSKNKKTKKV